MVLRGQTQPNLQDSQTLFNRLFSCKLSDPIFSGPGRVCWILPAMVLRGQPTFISKEWLTMTYWAPGSCGLREDSDDRETFLRIRPSLFISMGTPKTGDLDIGFCCTRCCLDKVSTFWPLTIAPLETLPGLHSLNRQWWTTAWRCSIG